MKINNLKKAKRNGLITGAVCALAIVLLVGGLGVLTKGFKEWDFNNPTSNVEDTRENLRLINLETNVNSLSALNSDELLNYLNDGLDNGVDPIFSNIAYIEKEVTKTDSETSLETTTIEKEYLCTAIYKDEGGMKIGKASVLGSFTADLVDNYKFNCAKIIGRNYSTYVTSSNKYTCDKSSISVNGSETQTFGTNEEDTSIIAPLEEKTFKFEDMQEELSISVLGKRAIVYSIELWVE